MTRSRLSTALCLLAGMAWAEASLSADSGFVLPGLLVEGLEQTLPLDPTKVLALDDAAYVIGIGDDGPQILLLDGSSLEIRAARSLDLHPADAIFSDNKRMIYVIGTRDDGLTRLVVLDSKLEQIGALTSKVPLAHPALSLAQGNMLMAGGVSTAAVKGAILAVDLTNPAAPRAIPALMPDTYNLFGIAGVWLDDVRDRNPTLFINTAELPTLVAVELGPKGVAELANLNFSGGSFEQEPLVILSNTSRRDCLSIADMTAFLVSSNINQSLFLAVFDPAFKSLDLISSTQSDLTLNTASEPEHYLNSSALRPTSLLASSCDMGVVWISNVNARELEQFAVNPYVTGLEKVGGISLSQTPSGLAISSSGRTGYVISAKARTITRYSSGSTEVSGTEEARALQRLLTERGYPVGAIDGQIGARTMSAVARFEERNKVDLDVQGDLEGALMVLQNAPVQ